MAGPRSRWSSTATHVNDLGWHLSRSGESDDRCIGARTRAPCVIRDAGASPNAVSAPERQWARVHQSPLHRTCAWLWVTAGVYHAALSRTEWHGRTGYSDDQRTMCPPAPIRAPAACQPGARGLDSVLQPSSPTRSVSYEILANRYSQ